MTSTRAGAVEECRALSASPIAARAGPQPPTAPNGLKTSRLTCSVEKLYITDLEIIQYERLLCLASCASPRKVLEKRLVPLT